MAVGLICVIKMYSATEVVQYTKRSLHACKFPYSIKLSAEWYTRFLLAFGPMQNSLIVL